MKKILVLIPFLLTVWMVSAQLPDPVQLMQKCRDLTLMGSMQSTLTLTIYEKNGSVRERSVSMTTKSYGETEKRMIKFLDPAEVRGTALLIVDNDKEQDDMWIYLPALKRTRRIVTKEKGKSFMSSEFSNADMSSAPLSDFEITHMPGSGENGRWILQSKCISEEKADEYGYCRKVTYVNKDDLEITRIEFYNYDNTLERSIDILSTKRLVKGEGYVMTEMFAKNYLNGRSSRIKYNDINTSAIVSDNVFTVDNLTR